MIEHSDVGCWIVKANPQRWRYFDWLATDDAEPVKAPQIYPNGWTLGNTYRNDMIRLGDLIALWVTGAKQPGIYEFGWVTSDEPYECDGFDPEYLVDPKDTGPCWAVEFASVRLRDNYLPRPEMKADPVLSGAEQFISPQGANPSYLNPDQAKALARHLGSRVSKAQMTAARWNRLL